MIKRLVAWSLLFLFCTACRASTSPTEVPTPVSQVLQPTETLIHQTPTQSIAETLPDLAISGLSGELWIRRRFDENYLVRYDLSTGERSLLDFPEECDWPFSANFFICIGKETYFLFPETHQQVVLSSSRLEWIAISPDTRWLTFPHEQADTIYTYEVATGTVTEIRNNGFAEILISPPVLSFDGKFVAWEIFVSGEGAYLQVMDVETQTIQKIEIESPLGGDISWSPIENILIFGEYIGTSDVGEAANQVKLLDPKTEEITTLVSASEVAIFQFFGSGRQVWSPDGQRVALSNGFQLCILTVLSRSSVCLRPENIDWMVSPTWSPDGKQIIFSDNRNVLFLFDPTTLKAEVLIDGIRLGQFDWK